MKILHLVLMGKFYDEIANGIKNEEYRAFNPYWCNRLIQHLGVKIYWNGIFTDNTVEDLLGRGKFGQMDFLQNRGHIKYDAVCFHRGYTKKTMMCEFKSLEIGFGNKEWGAPDKEVFIIKLGDRLNN